jgi:exosortase D (VPLPA-CTERM-specific)
MNNLFSFLINDPSTIKNQYSIKNIAIFLVISGLILTLYWDVFDILITVWNTTDEYSHGFMIPVISLYFLWQKKASIQAEKFAPSWVGIVIIIIAMIAYFIGTVGDVYFALRFSFIFLLIGLSLAISGYKVTKITLIPILILIFSFPLPAVLQAGLTAKLQLISSQLGVFIIRACQIPVYLEGNVIDLGSYKLQVVEACSGLRYLFPLMSLAFICAYMYQVAFWKRSLVFLTSIPITIFMNSFRIGLVGILVEHWGISMAEGFIHDFEGWIIFIGCLIVLVFEMWLLSWNDRKTRSWDDIFGIISDTVPKYRQAYKLTLLPLFYAGLLMIAAIIFIKPLTERQDIIPQRQTLNTFPLELENLRGHTSYLDKKTIDFLGLTDYSLIDFRTPKNQQINLYIAYYQTQKNGVVPHSPKLCIPGGGWRITELTEKQFKEINFNKVLINKGKQRQLVYYWYQQRGESIANEYFLKWLTFVGSLKHRRTDGALIRLTTAINSNENIQIADQRLQQFMLLIEPKLKFYVPN